MLFNLQVTECVDILCKYLDNIIANPTETKFHKIRSSNATFSEKVLPVFGAADFLIAAGFEEKILENNGVEDDYWVFDASNADGISTLEVGFFIV